MKRKFFVLGCLVLALTANSSFAGSEPAHKSKYVGQERREIKSLSKTDIEELKNGKGWGLAKAAELNGVPGPVHLLEMKEKIRLTPEQTQKIEDIFKAMKKEAIPLGLKLIELEREMNRHFANRTITDEVLQELLGKIAKIQKELRYVHLATHLKTPHILTPEQMTLYNKLRGYSTDDPCANIPEGHKVEMWKKHNNCP